jgi:hypothetical protein
MMLDVVLELEVRIILQAGVGEIEWNESQALAIARQQMKPLLEMPEQPLESEFALEK